MRLPASRVLDKIQKGTVAPGYMLIGADIYWHDRIARALEKALDVEASSFGLAEYDLREDPLDRVIEMAQSQSLLAPRQLIFVKNAQALLTRRGQGTESANEGGVGGPSSTSAKADSLSTYFHRPNPSSTIVFEMMDVDLESDDWRDKEKAKSRLEAFEGGAFEGVMEVIPLQAPRFEEAVEIARNEAAERGQKLSPQAAEQLVAAFHRNMALIGMEVEKLSLYQPEKGSIDLDDLSELAAGTAGEIGTGLTDAIGARNVSGALEKLAALARSGRYAPMMIAEVARFLRQLVVLKESKARDARQAAKSLWDAKLGAPQSAVPALLQQARAFSGTELLRGLELAFEADLALRCSPPSEALVLERFLCDVIGTPRPVNTSPSR